MIQSPTKKPVVTQKAEIENILKQQKEAGGDNLFSGYEIHWSNIGNGRLERVKNYLKSFISADFAQSVREVFYEDAKTQVKSLRTTLENELRETIQKSESGEILKKLEAKETPLIKELRGISRTLQGKMEPVKKETNIATATMEDGRTIADFMGRALADPSDNIIKQFIQALNKIITTPDLNTDQKLALQKVAIGGNQTLAKMVLAVTSKNGKITLPGNKQ